MAEESHRGVRCANCGHEFAHDPGKRFEPGLQGAPCPVCGDERKTYDVQPPPAVSRASVSLSMTSVRRFTKRNWWLIAAVVVLGVLPAALGFVFASPVANAVIGIACAALSFWLGFKAATRVREVTHHPEQ